MCAIEGLVQLPGLTAIPMGSKTRSACWASSAATPLHHLFVNLRDIARVVELRAATAQQQVDHRVNSRVPSISSSMLLTDGVSAQGST